jgi:hypothetical protein
MNQQKYGSFGPQEQVSSEGLKAAIGRANVSGTSDRQAEEAGQKE